MLPGQQSQTRPMIIILIVPYGRMGIKLDENSLQIVFLKYTDKMTAHGNLSCVEIILMDITSYGLCGYHQTVKLNSMSNFLSIRIILYMLVLGSRMT